jgi:2-keto-3-deoxy-L-rhamnonate aldolase RhmA
MIETLGALENVEEITAVEGINSLLIGSNDLCAKLSIPGDFDKPLWEDAHRKVVGSCNKSGVWVGVGGLHGRLDLVEKF